jgi:predicted GIY-YIG superfamily endonuclease
MSNQARTRGAAGSASGSGRVYVMKDAGNNYKIGCTSRDPEKRLKEIQRLEKNNDITLVGSERQR